MAPRAIPDRWIPYKALGSVIEGTKFICFKVPLRKFVQEDSKEKIKEVWDIETLLKKIPNLGYVIDLTNTARYYDPRIFKSAGVQHKKILMPGRIIPPESVIKEFYDAVDEFLGNNDGKLVGVHCTHGLNRTGFMVCRYMRDKLHIPPDEAIKRFEVARGYRIERENYLADILGRVPPPPDVGSDTILLPINSKEIKPIHNHRKKIKHSAMDKKFNDQLIYSRNYRDYDEEIILPSRSGVFPTTSGKEQSERDRDYKQNYEKLDRRHREGRKERSRERKSRSRSRSSEYDFRYDY